jgi:hypothetical protein
MPFGNLFLPPLRVINLQRNEVEAHRSGAYRRGARAGLGQRAEAGA